MKYIKSLVCVLCALLALTGCVSAVEENNTELYSRENVLLMESSDSFGYGKTDDIDVALSYIYNDSDIAKKHGTDFQLTGENIVCHYSECQTYFFSSFFSGKAKYTITIDNTDYTVELTKEKKGKWQVDKFYEDTNDVNYIDAITKL